MLTVGLRYVNGLTGHAERAQPQTAQLQGRLAQDRGGEVETGEEAEGKRGARYSPGLAPPELVLKRVREGKKGVVSTAGMPFPAQSPGPPGASRSVYLGLS